ncbi:MAG: uracil-DNA glycosylase, partial [Oscillospiraceae bacterium]|nr:uracil-DNA glycosylase [Oscillospiraceae bacterium]
KELQKKLTAARAAGEVYPPEERTLFALEATPANKVRVVILGQDPYHEPGQAMGLAFSVEKGCPLPPSLRNIYQELASDLGIPPASHGDLTTWAKEGVLLLNTVLTVDRGKANSHASFGWQTFTDGIISATNQLPQPIVFLLWGAQAQKKEALLCTHAPRLVLKAPHPSPLSSYRGFFGCKHFSQANAFLKAHGQKEICWKL